MGIEKHEAEINLKLTTLPAILKFNAISDIVKAINPALRQR